MGSRPAFQALLAAAVAKTLPERTAASRVPLLEVNSALELDQLSLPDTTENRTRVESAVGALALHLKEHGVYPRSAWLSDQWAMQSLSALYGWPTEYVRRLAIEFSRVTPGYTSDAEVEKALADYKKDRPGGAITIASLFKRAADAGWAAPPRSAPGPVLVADAAADALRRLNESYALVRFGATALIAWQRAPEMSSAGEFGEGTAFIELSAFRAMLNGRFVQVGRERRPLAAAWLEWTGRRQFDGVVFAPKGAPANMLNLYRGWGVKVHEGDIRPWLQLLSALVPDEVQRAYLLHWLAFKVQNPGEVPGTIIVMTGGKGAGKNSLLDPLVRAFGHHARVFDDAEQIAGRFTFHLMTVLFAVLDEAVFIGDPRQADRLKARVTATHMSYEAKGRDPVAGRNLAAFVSLSNHEHVWQATIDERRAVPIEVGGALVGRHDFWSAYYSWMEAGGASALVHHLLHLDISGFNPRAIPKSKALQRQVQLTALRDPIKAWWHAVLTDGELSWREGGMTRRVSLSDTSDSEVEKATIRACFEGYVGGRSSGWSRVMTLLKKWHGSSLREIRRRDDGLDRRRVTIFAALPKLREEFCAAEGVTIEAGDE